MSTAHTSHGNVPAPACPAEWPRGEADSVLFVLPSRERGLGLGFAGLFAAVR